MSDMYAHTRLDVCVHVRLLGERGKSHLSRALEFVLSLFFSWGNRQKGKGGSCDTNILARDMGWDCPARKTHVC